MANTISILGCGWLGVPLAEYLLGKGYRVKGSTTSLDKIPLLIEKGIQPYLLNIDDKQNSIKPEQEDFFDCDVLIINIPPKVRSLGEQYHPQQIATVIEFFRKFYATKIVYLSATSVYPSDYETVDENTILHFNNTENKALLQAENLLQAEKNISTLIFRCGGLLGYDRIPGKYYIGKTIAIGDTPVNYIHRDDVVRIIEKSLKKDKWQGVFNLVAPVHPSRKEVFIKNALDFGFDPPKFDHSAGTGTKTKMVSGTKIIKELPYEFLYPDPLNFYYTP